MTWIEDTANNAMDEAINYISELHQQYKDDPFVAITGFNVNVGVPPSVGVTFEFK